MSRASTLMILGLLVIFVPFSGFPSSIRSFFDFVLGAAIFVIGLMLRTRQSRMVSSETDTLSEPMNMSSEIKNTISSI